MTVSSSRGNSMIYTIGHSNHRHRQISPLLLQHGIDALADVRSTPYSRFNPQFGRDRLRARSPEQPRSTTCSWARSSAHAARIRLLREDGKVSYHKLAQTDLFRRGLERLLTGMREHRIAIMCAEREPLDCHRTILVSRELVRAGVAISTS